MKQYIRSKVLIEGDSGRLKEIITLFGSYTEEPYIRPEKILPLKNDTPEERKALWGCEELEETDVVLYHQETKLEYSFDTLHTPPFCLYEKIAEICQDLKVSVRYASEELGEDCGWLVSLPDDNKLTSQTIEDPFLFACEIWDKDPEEEQYEIWINEMEE